MYAFAVLVYNIINIYNYKIAPSPCLETETKLNVHILNVLCTFSLVPVSKEINDMVIEMNCKMCSLISTHTY